MRVKLAGVKQVTRNLADGRAVTYYYAWIGGPRLQGEPSSPEFAQSYAAAYRNRREPAPTTLHSVIVGFKRSPDFERLRDRTKLDYLKQIAKPAISLNGGTAWPPVPPRATTPGAC